MVKRVSSVATWSLGNMQPTISIWVNALTVVMIHSNVADRFSHVYVFIQIMKSWVDRINGCLT